MGERGEKEFTSCCFSVHWVEFWNFGLDATFMCIWACVCWARFDIRHTYMHLLNREKIDTYIQQHHTMELDLLHL